ncbi:MAG TPA: hypothetical protein VF116_22660 [Ktedonobacterales bacterium]
MSTYLRCTGCGLTFSSERAFCAHRTGTYAHGRQKSQRRCLRTSDEMHRAGVIEHQKNAGSRVVWTMAASVQSWVARRDQFSETPDIEYGHSDTSTSPANVAGAGGDTHAA